MQVTKQNISVIIVSFKSDSVLFNCIKSIDKDIEILVVDNADDKNLKKKLKKYRNIQYFKSNKNLGMGAGNNIGILKSEKEYNFIINPDVILKKNTIKNLVIAIKKIKDFGVIAPVLDDKNNPNYQLLDNMNDNLSKKNYTEVKSVDGFAMLINKRKLTKIKNFNFFDENFFMYLENDDFCKRLRSLKQKIFIIPNAKISHLGGKSVDSKYDFEIALSRNWHWMWSKFYFNKKYHGYFFALIIVMPNFISALLKSIFFLLIFKKKKHLIYLMRLKGIISSMCGKKSSYRPKNIQ